MRPFSSFFSDWVSGYYQNAMIGKDGDFYTSISASRFFGGAIANYILKKLENDELELPLNIIDIGANNTHLISDIYDFLDALSIGVINNCNFFVMESNAKIPQDSSIPNLKIIENLESLNPLVDNSFFIANEFFDALPCELYDNGKMAFIKDSKKNYKKDSEDSKDFREDSKEFSKIVFLDSKNSILESLLRIAEEQNIIKSEIPLSYFDFCDKLKRINPQNKKWFFGIFDYGDKYYTNQFNIRIFHKHKVFPLFNKDCMENIESYFKTSDITYNVPFLLLEKSFSSIGAEQILFKKQNMALIEDFGILDLLQKFHNSNAISEKIYLKESNRIKTLLNVLNDNFKTSIYINFKPKLI